jgi:hypothetical protein
VARMRNRRDTNRILVGNSEKNRQIIRPKRRLYDDIKMYPKKICWEDVGWLHPA